MPSPTSIKRVLAFQAIAGACVSASSLLLQGGTIVGWDEDTASLKITRDGSLLIEDDIITGIYEVGEAPSANTTAGDNSTDIEVVDVSGKILTPGFIDTHTHRWQTAYRTLASNTTLWEYFNRYGEFASEGLLDADDVYLGQLMGLYEALNAGTTTSLDHAHHTWSEDTSMAGLRASIDSGARVFWAYALRQLESFPLESQLADFRNMADSGICNGTRTSLGVASDYFGPDPVLDEIESVVELAKEYNVSVVTTHSLGSMWGIDNSPTHVHQLGLLNTSIPVVFSHASFLGFVDYQLLRETNQHASITPESEMHYGHLHPTSHMFMDQASLGVDTHFTFSVDLLTQARMWLQRVRALLFAVPMDRWAVPVNNPMSANQAFLLATRNGGLALRRPDLGVLRAGATADVVVWDGDSPGMLGWVDPVAAVMLHANVGDIEHVLVGGEFKKRDRRLILTVTDHDGHGSNSTSDSSDINDFSDLKTSFLDSARRVQARMLDIPPPQPEGLWESGAELARAPVADVLRGDDDGYGPVYLSNASTEA